MEFTFLIFFFFGSTVNRLFKTIIYCILMLQCDPRRSNTNKHIIVNLSYELYRKYFCGNILTAIKKNLQNLNNQLDQIYTITPFNQCVYRSLPLASDYVFGENYNKKIIYKPIRRRL